jgi:hypothetical protein
VHRSRMDLDDGSVAFAATDIYGGASKLIERQIEAADNARHFPMAVEGPLSGPLAVFSELLHVAFFADRPDDHPVAQTYRVRRPQFVALAARLRLKEHASDPLDRVLSRIWDELASMQPQDRRLH